MKKVLYGTTALVAAGLVAGEASAASALKLGITGFYRNAIGGSFGNGPTTQNGHQRRRRLDRRSWQFRPPERVDAPGNPRQLHRPDDPRQRHHRRRVGRSERRKRRQVRQHDPGQPRLCRFQRQVRPDPRRRGERRLDDRLRRRSGQRHLELRRQQPERVLQRRRLCPETQPDHGHRQCQQLAGAAISPPSAWRPWARSVPASVSRARATRSSTTRRPSAVSPSASPSRRRAASGGRAMVSPTAPTSRRRGRAMPATTSCRSASTTCTTSAAGT